MSGTEACSPCTHRTRDRTGDLRSSPDISSICAKVSGPCNPRSRLLLVNRHKRWRPHSCRIGSCSRRTDRTNDSRNRRMVRPHSKCTGCYSWASFRETWRPSLGSHLVALAAKEHRKIYSPRTTPHVYVRSDPQEGPLATGRLPCVPDSSSDRAGPHLGP